MISINTRMRIWLCWRIKDWNISACLIPRCKESEGRIGFFLEIGPIAIEIVSKLGRQYE